MPYRRSTFSRPRGHSSNRRRTTWASYSATIPMTANAQWYTVDLLQTYKAAVGAEAVGCTVMRTHLTLVPQALAATDRFWTGLKIYDLNDISAATTVNALIANPHDDPYANWAFMSQHITDDEPFVHPSGINVSDSGAAVTMDLKSKRRIPNVQETWGFCLYQDTVATVAKNYYLFARTLLALP